jgi:hypothetical protein
MGSLASMMKRKTQSKPHSKEVQIVTNSGWRFKLISSGLLGLIRTMWSEKDVKVGDALGPHWTLTICTIEKGKAKFFQGAELVEGPSTFAMFMPSYALMRGKYEGVHMTASGLVWFGQVPDGFPSAPIFLPISPDLLGGSSPLQIFSKTWRIKFRVLGKIQHEFKIRF